MIVGADFRVIRPLSAGGMGKVFALAVVTLVVAWNVAALVP